MFLKLAINQPEKNKDFYYTSITADIGCSRLPLHVCVLRVCVGRDYGPQFYS